MALTPEKVI